MNSLKSKNLWRTFTISTSRTDSFLRTFTQASSRSEVHGNLAVISRHKIIFHVTDIYTKLIFQLSY